MNHLKAFSCKSVLILFVLFNPYLFAEDDSSDQEKEKEEVYIEEMVKEYEELKGFFISYRDPKTNKIFLKINKDQLNKELESRYELSRPSFKTIGDNLKLNVKLKNNQNSDDLLKLLNQNSKVIHFKEVIPSANDIFINSVEND